MRLFSFLLALLLVPAAFGQAMGDPVAKGRRGTFAIVGARVFTMGPQGTLERGTVVIRDGRIEAVGASVAVPSGAEVIDGTGLEVYPGLIDGGTGVGTQEVGSVPETNDRRDVGQIIPHLQALTAVNPNSVVIPVTRVGGVTTVITEPVGGLFPGTAALIRLHGYTPEQMLVAPQARYVVLEFPRTGRRGGFDQRPDDEIQKAAKTEMKRLDDTWDAALQAARIDSAARRTPEAGRARPYTPELAALGAVIRGEHALMIKADVADDITKAIAWAQKRRVPKVILSGLAEGWRVADKIAASGFPAVVGPVLSIPTRGADRYDRAYSNPGLVAQAGGRIALRTGEVENARNLPFHAGFAAAYGLGRDAALRAVTIDAARTFGVESEIGSLEAGKAADVIVTTGDPFETRTQIRHVFIDGYNIPLVSRQTQLYQEFLNRNPGYTGDARN